VAAPEGSAFHAIRKWLDDEGVAYRHLHHEPTYTSEQAARVRGEDIRVGGKALLMKVDEDFRLFVLSAALKFDSPAVRHHFGIQRLRFATKQELHDLTGLVPGCVPPFGRPILPFDLFVDESIPANDRIAFNAGSLTDSIIMGVTDYMRLAQPVVFRFAVPP
jgi:Ala-tRNA(Pro) deacylase